MKPQPRPTPEPPMRPEPPVGPDRGVRMVRAMLWLPALAFLVILILVATGLIRPHDSMVHSRMVGQPMPAMTLPPVVAGQPALATGALADGRPHLVNFFASWCVPCAAEAPQLLALRRAGVPIEGIAVRDRPADTLGFLARYGNPFERLARDDTAAAQVALGSSGVPETFLVDGHGIIRGQHIGPIDADEVEPLIATVRGLR